MIKKINIETRCCDNVGLGIPIPKNCRDSR
jgi:hypothetical protein